MDTQFIQPSAIRVVPSLGNIVGVTGLSRACLRRLFSESVLFGAESALSGFEQAGVYTELQLPAGEYMPAVSTFDVPDHWRIAAIRSIARSILRQDVDAYERQLDLARRIGVGDEVLTEVVRTVQTAMLVYGAGTVMQRSAGLAIVNPGAGANDPSEARASA